MKLAQKLLCTLKLVTVSGFVFGEMQSTFFYPVLKETLIMESTLIKESIM